MINTKKHPQFRCNLCKENILGRETFTLSVLGNSNFKFCYKHSPKEIKIFCIIQKLKI